MAIDVVAVIVTIVMVRLSKTCVVGMMAVVMRVVAGVMMIGMVVLLLLLLMMMMMLMVVLSSCADHLVVTLLDRCHFTALEGDNDFCAWL